MPKEVLARVGLILEDINTVIMSHCHFDHMGGLKLFLNAHFYIQKDELLESLAALSLDKKFNRQKMLSYLVILRLPMNICDGRMILLAVYFGMGSKSKMSQSFS